MEIIQILGHNSKWNLDIYAEQEIGDLFLITAYTHGSSFLSKKPFQKIIPYSIIDLQFYGKKETTSAKGKLSEFSFHPVNIEEENLTNVYFENCMKEAIKFQINNGFKRIIIPHFYENEEVSDIISTIKMINNYVKSIKEENEVEFYMTLPFANHIIIDRDKVEQILVACTDMEIVFDGYFLTCETKPEAKKKLTTELKIFKNFSKVLKTLKWQGFKTIYAYANWDALLYLAQTDIDYITIASYENLRNFDIKRYTEDRSGGASKGFYFSEKLLNMIKADDLTKIRNTNNMHLISNEKNIFSEVILNDNYHWNIHKPDVNKNYMLSIARLLKRISSIENIEERKKYVLHLIDNANKYYNELEKRNVFLEYESSNYHLNFWKTYLANA